MKLRSLSVFASVAFAAAAALIVACDGDDSNSAAPSPSGDAAPNDATFADHAAPSSDAGGDAAVDGSLGPQCGDAGSSTPSTLECTGLYSDFASKTVASGVLPYAPAVSSWNDGATAQRWVYLPPGTTIDDTVPDAWTFPIGTRFWMQLSFGGQPVETRYSQKVLSNYWVSATYLWSADGSTATSFGGGNLSNVVTSDAGTQYHVPSSTECTDCHRGGVDHVLGFEAVGLGTSGAQGLTLSELASQNLLSPAPAQTTFTVGDDGTGKAAVPLAWLHANCGLPCHNRTSNALASGTGEYFRLDPSWLDGGSAASYDSLTTTINVPAVTPAWIGTLRIDPGAPSQSLVCQLAGSRSADYANQMPPIVTQVVPAADIARLDDWIASMPNDAGTGDGGGDAGAGTVTGVAITTANGVPLAAVPGTALPLQVVLTLSNGSTQPIPVADVTWTSPQTITAQDPNNPGPATVLPDGGASPTAFYVQNPYRADRADYPGLLFVITQGTEADAGVTVSAQLADGGVVSAVVPVGAAPTGDPDAGAALFENVLRCMECHGATGDGSPPATLADGGPELDDAGDPLYALPATLYPYPAPGLNDTSPGGSPNVGADPQWNAALLGMAAQGDFDNFGVALRYPMPDWSKGRNAQNQPLTAQDFANIYAWLKTQTQ